VRDRGQRAATASLVAADGDVSRHHARRQRDLAILSYNGSGLLITRNTIMSTG